MKHSSSGYGSGVLKHHGPGHSQAKPTGAPKHLVVERVKGAPADRGVMGKSSQGGRSENNPKA